MTSLRGVVRLAPWLVGALVLSVLALGSQAERWINTVDPVPLPALGAQARDLHRVSTVIDLHADSLLFSRDLLTRSGIGHVDLPRLHAGGVALQVFGAPTRFPLSSDLHNNANRGPDVMTLVGFMGRNPMAIRGPYGRALWMAEQLDAFVADSEGALVWIRSRADLESLLAARAAGREVVGALYGLEGAHALEHGPGDLDAFFAVGVRMVGLAHFFDNAYAGSAHGIEKGGLSVRGRTLVRRMEELGVIVDLAHVSPDGIDDVLAMATRPTVVSHGGVRATCDNPRNLSDRHIRAIAAGGGVIGIGYFDLAVCGEDLRFILAAMHHVIGLVGADHVALGSDYDGGTTVGFDTSQLPALTQALLDEGIPPSDVSKILGGNALRVLRATLPPAAPRS